MNAPETATQVTMMRDWQIQDFADTFGFDADRVERVLIVPIGEDERRVQFALTFVFKDNEGQADDS